MKKSLNTNFLVTLFICSFSFLANELYAQSVSIGAGSYSTVTPAGKNEPQTQSGQPAIPRVSTEFNQLVNTNDYWSNLIFPYRENNHLNDVPAHPVTLFSSENGFNIGYLNTNLSVDNYYYYSARNNIVVSIAGLSSNRTSTHSYGDWTFSAKLEYENASLVATTGHGLPYTYFDVDGGDIQVASDSTFNIWHNVDEVIGLSMAGVHYGLFAPNGSSWTGTDTLTSSLNNKGFLSVAILPDSTSETLEYYRSHAYAQVTNSVVEWDYDEFSSDLTSTFTYETVLIDSADGNSSETLTALYRHQWLNTSDILTNYTYVSPRGTMKVFEGNSFSTTSRFSGILPTLPDLGDYDRIQLLEYVKEIANEILPISDTYNNGKQMGRFAEVVHIADQLGAIAERDYLLSELKTRLEDWFTAGGEQQYYYNDTWNTLIGYPDSFGSAKEINDHHFHAAYAIRAAATIAQYDSVWASQDNWGGMVNMLIRDANNWTRNDELFPFLRNFDAYAGHAWASGHGDFNFAGLIPGNNQESSSESMNFNSSTILWGEITGQDEIRDLGIFLYTNENAAIDQYWFDVDNEVFPEDFPHNAIGRVWGSSGDHNTWFGSDPEFIHGINFLPINAGSFYLGKNPAYIIENYDEIVAERGGQPIHWKDVFWQYLAMSDADLALSYYNADQGYQPFDGESRAHTLHWLHNISKMGQFNTEVTADIPIYAVFVNDAGDTTYTAYNAASADLTVHFSDGFSFIVPAKTLKAHRTVDLSNNIPPAPEPTKDSELVMSIFSDSYASFVDADFNPDEGQATVATLEIFEGNNVLKYENLDVQSILLQNSINISTRDTFHVDLYTNNPTASNLQVALQSTDDSEIIYDFGISDSSWQSLKIPLGDFIGAFDATKLQKIKVMANSNIGTLYLDNIFFSGDEPVQIGPAEAAPTPVLDQENVLSIFSDVYQNLSNTNYNPNWGQETQVSFVEIDGNNTLKYTNLNYQGSEFENPINVADMEWIHLDYWTSNSTELKVYLISPGPLETSFEIDVKQNDWQSIDIPLSEYVDVVNLSEVFQLKIEGNGTIFFDNLYFAKPSELSTAPTPIHDSDKVVSLFSNHYENIVVDTWSAPWDQADVEDATIQGDDVKLYTNVNFAGIEFFRTDQIDGTDLTHLYFNLWTEDPIDSTTNFKVKLVDFGANGSFGGGDDVEHELTFDKSTTEGFESKSWIIFDIPLNDFVNMTTRANLSQLLFVSRSSIDDFYLDNLYFYTGDATNAEINEEMEIPVHLELQQNYPNPFNPSTNIEFSIPNPSNVKLSVFNAIGQHVGTLIDSQLSPGSYSVEWDASGVATGIYFYQLRTAEQVITKQMLLIK
ncbi:MAG: T9SS type A sorting domain-containing protein [Balneolaceae bacterium]|nr:T9SS type A sorting domain-containing protein [Balneolaceae bacterium]